MSDFETTITQGLVGGAPLAGGVLIVAEEPVIAAFRSADVDGLFAEAHCLALGPGDAIPEEALGASKVLVVEVDPAVPASIDRVRAIRTRWPSLPVIAALRSMDVSAVRMLVRQGAADVAEMPLVPSDLARLIADVGVRSGAASSDDNLAALVCVVGGTGGCGATTIITHLAQIAAKKHKAKVCVVDLDLQSGEVAYYVGRSPRITVERLFEAGERIDADFIRSTLTDSERGFSLIAAPDKVTPLDEVQIDQLLAMLQIVRREFDLVLVDLPSDWTSWSLSVAAASDDIVLVTDLSVACLRQSRRRLDLFDSVGIDRDRVALVANRVERKLFKAIDLDDAAQALGHSFFATLADEGHAMSEAQDEGRLITDIRSRTKFSSDLEELAERLLKHAK